MMSNNQSTNSTGSTSSSSPTRRVIRVQNPYAARKRPRNNPPSSSSTSSTPQTVNPLSRRPQYQQSNNQHRPVQNNNSNNNNGNYSYYPSASTATTGYHPNFNNSSAAADTNSNNNPGDCSFDDSSFDWDEAIRIADNHQAAAAASAVSSQNNNSNNSDSQMISSSQQSWTSSNSSSHTDHHQSNSSRTTNVMASYINHQSSSGKPPLHNNIAASTATANTSTSYIHQRPTSRSSMNQSTTTIGSNIASLRPPAWSSSSQQQQKQRVPTANAYGDMKVSELRRLCNQQGIDTNGMIEKQEMIDALVQNSNNKATATATTTTKTTASFSPSLSQQQRLISRQGTTVPSPMGAQQHTLMSQLPTNLRFSPEVVQPATDSYRKDLIKHATLSKPLANGWKLYDHQKKAVLKSLLMRRFVLALDMGLGKTLIGCVWIRSFQKTFPNCKAIVVCPTTLKTEWTRTAKEATELKVMAEATKKKKKTTKKRKKKNDDDDNEIDDENEIENVIDDTTTPTNVEICSWAKVPKSVDKDTIQNFVVVCDECHMMQSMESARTQNVLKLVQQKKCVGVLLLSGTPLKNGKPKNLFPLLRAVQHPFGRNQRAYETQFCAGRQKQFGRGPPVWDASGSSNLNQLSELVSSHMLYMSKDECLKSLPKATRQHNWIPVSHRQKMQYAQAIQRLERAASMSSAMETENQEVLGALNEVRTVGAFSKVDATVELAKKTLDEEPALVIFTNYVKVAKAIHSKLEAAGWAPAELLTGETPPPKRQAKVDNFQNGLSPAIILTFGVGGVGLTLTAARTCILVDRPWTPGDAAQAEDRIRRIGQQHPVKSIWLSSFDVDKQIDQMIESKAQTSNTVLTNGQDSSKTNGLAAGALPKISIMKLISAVLPENNPPAHSNPKTLAPSMSQASINDYYFPPEH